MMVNGVLEAALPCQDRALHYGDGLFETMRLEGGRLPLLAQHLQRLESSSAELGMSCDVHKIHSWLIGYLKELARSEITEGAVKLILSRGSGPRGYLPNPVDAQQSNIFFFAHQFKHQENSPIELQALSYRLSHNPVLAGHKHLSKLEYVIAARELESLDSAALMRTQGLLLDVDQWVIETLHYNIFMVQGNTIVTPRLDRCGVAGVLRRLIIEQLAPREGLSVSEARVSLEAINNADEVFITNSVRGIVPVAKIQEKQWQNWPVTSRLIQGLDTVWNARLC